MIHLLFIVLLCVLALYLLGRIYSSISGDKPTSLLKLKDIHESVKKMSGVWLISIPFISFFAMIYNVCLFAVWFILALIGLLTKVVGWIWTEIVIAGGYFLFQQLWHYFIIWPWTILRMAFESIKSAFSWAYFKIGLIGLFLSLAIIFTGRYFISTFEWWDGLDVLFVILSLIPIGVAISYIINSRNGNRQSNLNVRNNYIKHVSVLVIAFLMFFVIEYILIYAGSLTSIGYSFSALMAGGNIFVSFFIILNAGLLLFILSALPSFSQDYTGTNKDLLKNFGSHLLHKWPQYLLALPALIIPGIIISIIPYFLSQGAISVTKEVSNKVYNKRIVSANKDISELKEVNYADWYDVEKMSDDSIKKEMSIDLENISKKAALARLNINHDYMTAFYNKHSSYYGAAPFFAMSMGYDAYSKNQDALIKTDLYVIGSSNLSEGVPKLKNNLDSNVIPNFQKDLVTIESSLAKLNEDIIHACDPPALIQSPENKPTDSNIPEIATTPPAPIDECTAKKNDISNQIDEANQSKIKITANKARAEMISKHFGVVNEKINRLDQSNSLAAKIGYFLITLWMCLIMAFCFAFIIPLFAILNHGIYMYSDGSEKYYLIEKIEAAYQKNKNQPLLGLLLLPFLFPVLMSLYSFLNPIKSYTKEVIDSVKAETIYKKTNQLMGSFMSIFGMSSSCCEKDNGQCEMKEEKLKSEEGIAPIVDSVSTESIDQGLSAPEGTDALPSNTEGIEVQPE